MPNYTGDGADNTFAGDGTNETIIGNGGSDTLSGNGGEDIISGDAGGDTIFGGDGSDMLYSAAISPAWNRPYFGNPWTAPVLDSGTEVDTINGGTGFDLIFAGYGDNVDGGADSAGLLISFQGASSGVSVDFRTLTNGSPMTIGGGTLANIYSLYWIVGSEYDDTIRDGDHDGNFAPMFGGGGNDHLIGGYYTGEMHGGSGDDTIDRTDSGYPFPIFGDDGNDTIFAGNSQSVYGGNGNDTIYMSTSAFSLIGGPGYDTLSVNIYVINAATAISEFEVLELRDVTFSSVTFSGSQFANGFASDLLIKGTGAITVNMTAGVDFFTTVMTPDAGSAVTFTVNGTSGDDAIKGGQFATTVNAGDGADVIRTGNLVDTIDGGIGNDKIAGRGGADILTGGAGSDTFRYVLASDSGLGVNADHITDFAIGTDKLAFRALDPDLVTPGVQSFAFIDTQAFHATGAAEIHYANSGADLLVEADLNGDGIADMQIFLNGLAGQTLTGLDFLI